MKILFNDLLLQGSKKNGVWYACGLYDNTDDFLFFSVSFSISSSPICCLSVYAFLFFSENFNYLCKCTSGF